MFRKKRENKAKLEHKLYLARETPEPVFDLSDCGIKTVPQGIYSLCKVFLKEVLRLEENCLTSLSGGGQLKDLAALKVLDLHSNAFVNLPEELGLLTNLKELYLNGNQLKKLPSTICDLINLSVLNVADNLLRNLPDNMGALKDLTFLSINSNKHLKKLPRSLGRLKRLNTLSLDCDNFEYPSQDVAAGGTEAIIRFICEDTGLDYIHETEDTENVPTKAPIDECDHFEAKIWKFENLKQQRLQDFLDMERSNQLLQQQEFELAQTQKLDKEKLLADITRQQDRFDKQLLKLQQEKEIERFHLIEQVLQVEENADHAIQKLLEMTNDPLTQLLQQESEEKDRLLAAANKYTTLRTDDILTDMQILLEQELKTFRKYHENRLETSKTILEQEIHHDDCVSEILQNQDLHKAELIMKLRMDADLQRAAVGTLLERGDARSWSLLQQVKLVESQLVALTQIELDKKKLEIDQNLNDLCDKRLHLSYLLVTLLEQQKKRRNELLSTLQTLEQFNDQSEDFWLKQYQKLLEKLPEGLSEAQKNIDPLLAQSLLMNGVINCLPFLASLTQSQCDVLQITDEDLKLAGILNKSDRVHILDAFQMYRKERIQAREEATAPPVEEASAPPLETCTNFLTSECVICLDKNCEIIFLPCGHFCCCLECHVSISDCPMCRSNIERKIRLIKS